MLKPSSPKDQVLAVIEKNYETNGCPATITDIMEEVGFKSPKCVTRYYDELEKEGLIRRHRGHAIPNRFKIIRLARVKKR